MTQACLTATMKIGSLKAQTCPDEKIFCSNLFDVLFHNVGEDSMRKCTSSVADNSGR